MPKFKDADIVAHAIHSHLQLVSARVLCKPEWAHNTADHLIFINANWELIKAIEKSVKLAHSVNVNHDAHIVVAAKMFIYSQQQKSAPSSAKIILDSK